MAAHSSPFPLLLLAITTLFLLANAAAPPILGAPREIKNVKNNTEVQELGRFCVQEYNKRLQQSKGPNAGARLLSFSEVVAAKSQVVAGTKYYLTISAVAGGAAKKYDAVAVVVPWRHSRELMSFAPSTAH